MSEIKIFHNGNWIDVSWVYNLDSREVTLFKWSKIASTEKDSLKIIPDVQRTYYKYVETWIIKDSVLIQDCTFTSPFFAASIANLGRVNWRSFFISDEWYPLSRYIFINYIKNNINKDNGIEQKAKSEINEFNKLFPLETLWDLPIERYDYRAENWEENKAFINWIEKRTDSLWSWHLASNYNKLFYRERAKSDYDILSSLKPLLTKYNTDIRWLYKIFIKRLADFIKTFNEENYSSIEDYPCKDFLERSNVIKMKVLLLYQKPLFWITTLLNVKSLLTDLWVKFDKNNMDVIEWNILLKNELLKTLPELKDKSTYVISKCLREYIHWAWKDTSWIPWGNVIKKENINYYAVWADLWYWSKQDEFYNHSKLIIWWYELWSLKNFTNDDELLDKFKECNYHDTESHFLKTFENFKSLKAWDIVCLKWVHLQNKEMYIYAVWVVQDNYEHWYEYLDWLWHSIPVKWKRLDERYVVEWAKYQKTLERIKDKEMQDLLEKLLGETTSLPQNTSKTMIDLNTILYWVPWTGKTYHTINYALSIIENKTLEEINSEDRDELRRRYDEYLKEWRIVFTTFHQSFWYEDFIEGIKAEVEEWWISYKIKDWIFKELCLKISKWEWKNSDNFDESRNKLVDELNEKDTIDIPFLSWKWSFKVELNEYWTWLASRTYDENWEWIRWHSKFFNYDQLYNIYKWLPWVPAWWHDNYRKAVVNEMKKRFWLNEYQENLFSDNKKNYVLIIDEINRWNISKIFWELITLLEPDKRLWWKEELKVKLPYSQDEFWIPCNVYVLWTMNTADRSIALMDLALRRRFKFREIEPNPELLNWVTVAWIDIKELFITLNKRIEFLYDRDHLLGHAYFLPLKKDNSLEKLNSIMLDNIVPLLQEYFHDDWEKIQLVLWQGIIKKQTVLPQDVWISNNEYDEVQKYFVNPETLSAQDYPH